MATDIAFAVGVLTLLGNRVPSRLKVFLLTLAIVDDLGAILVIAVFYTTSPQHHGPGHRPAPSSAGMVVLRLLGVWWMPIYVLAGTALWFAVFESGVHATLAGVACGLLAPAKPRRPANLTEVAASADQLDRRAEGHHLRHPGDQVGGRPADPRAPPLRGPAHRPGLRPGQHRHRLHPGSRSPTRSARSTGLAIMAGLVLGKPIGVGPRRLWWP